MKKLEDYFKLQKEIYEYFNYTEDWAVIPLEDSTKSVWKIQGNSVDFADDITKLNDYDAGDYYSNEIYYQRFLDKHIYRGKDYTMICVDTHTDGNKFLQVFDNDKEVK